MVQSLDQDNVRRLSVRLLIDLLNLEKDAARAPELARDVATLGEDLLMAGDYAGALEVTQALGRARRQQRFGRVARRACGARRARQHRRRSGKRSTTCRSLDDTAAAVVAGICTTCRTSDDRGVAAVAR